MKKTKYDRFYTTLNGPNLIGFIVSKFVGNGKKHYARIAAVHSSSIKYSKSNRRIFLLRTLSLFYRYFENIICISDSIKYDLIDNYNVSQHRLVKIANPIITNHSKRMIMRS